MGSDPMLNTFHRGRWAAWISCAMVLAPNGALAGADEPCVSAVLTLAETAELLRVQPDEVEQLAERLEIPARRIGDSWRFSCASVMTWLNGDSSPVPAAESSDLRRSLSESELSSVTGTGSAGQPGGPAPEDARAEAAVEEPAVEEPIGEAPDEPTAEDVLLRDQRLLVSRRDVTLNFGQFYSQTDSQILASSDEGNVLAAVEQAAFLTTFQARVGVGEESEMFVSTSYVDQDSDVFVGTEKIASSGRNDFGDVHVGFRHTLRREDVGRANIIGTLTARVPTGDGSYAIGGGLGFLKSFDPVALFASVNYTRTFTEDFADITALQPEHRLDASLGFALAVNDTLSLSGSVAALFTGATESSSANLRQQDGYSLGFGLTSRVSQRIYLEPAVSIALGGPADGFAFGVSLFTFRP
jgi:excisionase family DNA binding protein